MGDGGLRKGCSFQPLSVFGQTTPPPSLAADSRARPECRSREGETETDTGGVPKSWAGFEITKRQTDESAGAEERKKRSRGYPSFVKQIAARARRMVAAQLQRLDERRWACLESE